MQLNLNISQIFLPKRKDAKGYVSVYEETVRTDNPVTLFVVIEVGVGTKTASTNKSPDLEKLSQALAGTFKRTFISESRVDDYTFEKALNNLNQELSNLAHKGVVGWYKKLNAVVAAYYRGTLHVTVAGTGSAMLLRDGEFTEISDSLSSGDKPHPLKTFVNFASGSISDRDVVLLGSSGIYNFLSLEKIRITFSEFSLAEATKDLINILDKDAPQDQPFATFVVKATTRAEIADEDLAPLMTPASHTIIEERESGRTVFANKISSLLKTGFSAVGSGLRKASSAVASNTKRTENSNVKKIDEHPLPQFTPKKSKKGLILAVIIVGGLLALSLLFFNLRNSQKEARSGIESIISDAASAADEAEASLIYNDESTALEKIRQARDLLAQVSGSEFVNDEYNRVQVKLDQLAARLNKEQVINNTETIAQFEHSPTKLIRTGNGFAGLNTFINSIETFDLQSSATATLTTGGSESLVDGSLDENFAEPVLLSDSGELFTLGLLEGKLQLVSPTSTPESSNFLAVDFYAGRAYALDSATSQIYRYNEAENGFTEKSAWLSQTTDLSLASDLAIDGNIYILKSNEVLKFTSGNQVNFSLQEFSPGLSEAAKIVTNADFDFIYILEPSEQRILVINKDGVLVTQLVSEAFSDLKDFWVEESSKTMYVLNGSNLLRFGY